MRSGEPIFLDFGNRRFEYVIVHPRPMGRNGEPCDVHVDLGQQRIEVAAKVPADDREAKVRKAMAQALAFKGATFVPVASLAS